MKDRRRIALLVSLLALGFYAAPALAQELAPPPAPAQTDKKNDRGMVVAEVKFAEDGTVATCRIVRSNLPYPLEAGTVDYIRRKWVNKYFAGDTVRFPLTFDELPWYAKHWDDGIVAPPNFLPPGDPGRKLKLRVTFGPDGWAQKVEVEQTSALDAVDRQTAIWVKVHWHNEAFAGQTLDAPFIFKTPVGTNPAVAKTTKPRPKAAAPTEQEPAAVPAVRVE